MSEHVDPCHHDGKPEHTYGPGCPGHPRTGLIPEVVEWLDRLDAGDPIAVEGFNRLFTSMGFPAVFEADPEPILSPEEQRRLNAQIEEGQRIRAQGAASGANYLIGGAAPEPASPTRSEP